MSATDSFEWLLKTAVATRDTELQKFMKSQRKVMLRLRNEDERTRFVFNLIKEIRTRKGHKS